MSPIQDPRFSSAHKSQMRQQDRDAGERAARMEYIKPTVMLLLGGGIVVGYCYCPAALAAPFSMSWSFRSN